MSKRYTVLLIVLLMTAAVTLQAQSAAQPETRNGVGPGETVGSVPSEESEMYTAERAIIRDEATGALRVPTAKETADLVSTLKGLTKRTELKAATTADGMEMVDLQGEYQMTIIARATEAGYETLCVASFEEGANFLGLKRIEAPKPGKEGQQ